MRVVASAINWRATDKSETGCGSKFCAQLNAKRNNVHQKPNAVHDSLNIFCYLVNCLEFASGADLHICISNRSCNSNRSEDEPKHS